MTSILVTDTKFYRNLSLCLRDFHSFFKVISQIDLRFQHDLLLTTVTRSATSIISLKERLTEEWRRFDQNIIDRAVNEWRDRLRKCIRVKEGHFECLMQTVGLFRLTLAAFENSWRSAELFKI